MPVNAQVHVSEIRRAGIYEDLVTVEMTIPWEEEITRKVYIVPVDSEELNRRIAEMKRGTPLPALSTGGNDGYLPRDLEAQVKSQMRVYQERIK